MLNISLSRGFHRLLRSVRGAPLPALTAALITAGCASFQPHPGGKTALSQRAVHREDAYFGVDVAVPTSQETALLFDRKLERKGIQPVCLRVENRGNSTAYFLPNFLDADYFDPLEVAYQYHSLWRPKRNAAMDLFFVTNAMPDRIPAGSERSGFVFTHSDLGSKQVCVSLAANPEAWQEHRYTFIAEVPGLQADWEKINWEQITNSMQVIACDDSQLRAELEKLPRAATSKSGKKEGDPLNLVLIGNPEDLASMAGCGWDQTERMTFGTAWRSAKSFLFGSQYRYSPVSSLYYAGRHQDVALQKARSSIKLRNHLRLWLTPLTYHGKPVWIGQISRDIGVRWTLQTPNLTTHKINPNVDEARAYLIRDLARGQAVRWWGFVKGVQPAPYHAPRRNLTGDSYYTDGLRVVMELSSEPIKPADVRCTEWEIPPYKFITSDVEPAN